MSEPHGGQGQGHKRWSVGDVEQEAEQLVAAARRWLQSVPMNARSGQPGQAPSDPWADLTDRVGEQPDRAHDPRTGAPGGQPGQPGQEHRCTGCPWCRARSAMGPVGAETLDSLADLLTSASESLRAFAEHRRERATGEPVDTTEEAVDTTHEADATDEADSTEDADVSAPAEQARDQGAQP